MGSFIGHLLPGVSMALIAIWWALAISLQLGTNPRAYRNRATHPWPGARISPESWCKIFFCSIGIIGEAYTGFDSSGYFTTMGNLQHITMYVFFLMSGIVDIFYAWQRGDRDGTTRGPIGPRNLLPPGSDFAALIIGALIEWLLFRFHLHGRTPLDVLVHTLLGHSLMVAVLIACAECAFPDAPVLGYLRSIAVLTHGLWFITIGSILHTPWGLKPPVIFRDPEDHKGHMVATCLFAWHWLIAILICVVVAALSRRCVPKVANAEVEYTRCPEQEGASLKEWTADGF